MEIKEGKEHDSGRKRGTHDRRCDAPPSLRPSLRRIGSGAEPLNHHQPVLHQDAHTHAEAGKGQQVGGDVEEIETE